MFKQRLNSLDHIIRAEWFTHKIIGAESHSIILTYMAGAEGENRQPGTPASWQSGRAVPSLPSCPIAYLPNHPIA